MSGDFTEGDLNSLTDSFINGGSGGFGLGDLGAGLGAAGGLIGGIASGLGSFDSAQGAQDAAQGFGAESQAYTEAAGYAKGQIPLEQELVKIQQYQTNRQLAMAQGSATALASAQGLEVNPNGKGAPATSASDILAMNAQQGALAVGLIGVQGQQQEQAYRAQASMDIGLAQQATANQQAAESTSAATTGGIGDILGGVFKAGAAILPFL